MAGTTVRDGGEVLHCFAEACRLEGLTATSGRLNALMGVSKLEVFQLLWREQLGPKTEPGQIEHLSRRAFHTFREILENHYREQPVEPADGAPEVFEWLRGRGVLIALNTGFYRAVTDIILHRIGWAEAGRPADLVIASDEVPRGRPEPFMIQKAMKTLGVDDPRKVVKIGDTPADLLEGRRAGCALSLAVTNGTHTQAELELLDHDGLLISLRELPAFLTDRQLP